jgi:serine/threonine protein kinase
METSTGNLFEMGRVLKECIFGQVNHAIGLQRRADGSLSRTNPPQQYAIKIYRRQKLREYHGRTQENPHAEIAGMQFVGPHQNVMSLVECTSDADNVYSIMEFVDGGELFDVLEDEGPMPEARARAVFRDILCGLEHLHTAGVAHRDMSLENVMFSRTTGSSKIIDFGMSLRVPRAEGGAGRVLLIPPQGTCGKRNYISPEVFENAVPFDPQKSDIWALGIMLFILLTGIPPMDCASTVDPRYRLIAAGRLSYLLSQWNVTLSNEVVDLIERILRPLPGDRLTLAQIREHPWMQHEA